MDFWLVQRMNRNTRHRGPIEKAEHLSPAYMGVAEFEFNALSQAYQIMKGQPLALVAITVKAFGEDRKFYVVSRSDNPEILQPIFQKWADQNFKSCQDTKMKEALTRKDIRGETISDERYEFNYPFAWWDIGELFIFWSLDETIARAWLESFATVVPT